MIFTGNNESTLNRQKLNSVVKVQGEGVDEKASKAFSSASGNINVVANGTDTLTVQLNKDVSLTKDGSLTIGDIKIKNGDVNMGGNVVDGVHSAINQGNDSGKSWSQQLAEANYKLPNAAVNVSDLKNTADDLNNNINNVKNELKGDIADTGALGAALSALKPIQYDPLEPNQIMAGVGTYRGSSAIGLGLAHYTNESTMIHAGMAYSGGDGHIMANAGITWKYGYKADETAIADRYRQGPISSAYALQDEVSALKERNDRLEARNAELEAKVNLLMEKMGVK